MTDGVLILNKILISLALGALIGIEREKNQQKKKRMNIGGIRTFMFITLLGTLSVYISLSSDLFKYLNYIISIGFILFLIVGYYVSAILHKDIGMTTEFSAVIAFMIGILVYLAPQEIAIGITILVTLILSMKIPLHHFVRKLKTKEYYDTIKFIIIAFVILPLLPNKNYGPLEVFNPYKIWLMVVFISGLSFIAYILIKTLGAKKGIGITGFLGGFVSSTALVISMAQRSKQAKKAIDHFVLASVIATSTMFIRVLIEISILNQALLPKLIIPMLSMSSIGYFWSFHLTKQKSRQSVNLDLKSPFTLKPALTFGIIFAIVLFLTKAAEVFYGTQGVYISSFISGLADIDAVAISMANLSLSEISSTIAVKAITIAACTNTLTKVMIAYSIGNKDYKKNVSFIFSIMIIIGMIICSLL